MLSYCPGFSRSVWSAEVLLYSLIEITMLFKAKTGVTFREILRNPGDTFDVTNEEAVALGWNVENGTVEAAEPTAPVAPAEESAAPAAPETPANTEGQSTEGEPTAPVAPTTEKAPEPTSATE